MPETPIYSLPFEQTPSDQPGITLHGGDPPSSPILAETVETELERIDAAVSGPDGLTDRVSTIETETVPGWTYIGHGHDSGTLVDLDITAGGLFPAGTFAMIRIQARFNMDTTGWLVGRPNNVHDSIYRSAGLVYGADGVLKETFHNGATSGWRIAQGDEISTANMTMTIFHTEADNLLSFQGNSTRPSNVDVTHRWGQHWGSYSASAGAVMSNIRITASIGASSITNLFWWLEGFRLP